MAAVFISDPNIDLQLESIPPVLSNATIEEQTKGQRSNQTSGGVTHNLFYMLPFQIRALQ